MANPRIEDLRRRLEKEPQSRLFAQLAEELRKDGDLKEAIRVARDGLGKHPAYASARMTLGRALQDVGDIGGARAEFEAVLTAAPDNILAGRLLAQCLEGLGFLDAALARYRATLMLSPGDPQLVGRVATLEGRVAGPPVPAVATAAPLGAQPVTPQEREPPEAASGGAPLPLPGEAPEAAAASASVPQWKPIESGEVPLLPADEEFGLREASDLPDSGSGVRAEAATLPEEAELIPEAAASEGEAQVPFMAESVAEDFELESPYEASMTAWKEQGPGASEAELILEGAQPEAEAPIPLVADFGGEEFQLESAYEASMTAWKEPGPAASEAELILEGAQPEAEAPIPLVADSGGEEFELESAYEASMPTWKAPEPSAQQAHDLVSPTLGELYFNQGHTEKAIDVYRRVLEQEPGNDRVRARLMELEAIERHLRAEETPEALQSMFGMRGDPRAARREALKRTIARLEDLRAAFRGARP